MGDVLSQAEVESLLTAMEKTTSGSEAGGGSGAQPGRRAPMLAREKVTPYDFKRPERVGKEQMRALQTLHEGFGRNFGAALSGLLRSIVEVKLTSVDQLTYSEFIFSLENPTCFNVIKAAPLEGNLILDLNPSILYPIIDRLLGGGKEAGPFARRPLTEIELRLISRITKLFLDELKHAWENVLPLELSIERVESNPQLVQIVPPNEVIVLISFDLTIGEARGMINLCIPFNSIERFGNKLTANSWATYSSKRPTEESIRNLSGRLHGALVEVVAQLAHTKITTQELIELRVGDIITTEKDIREPVSVLVEECPKFRASLGSYKGHKAIQIEEQVEAADPPTKVAQS